VRSVLVCVRTTLAAQAVASSAIRLGIGPAVRTAISTTEALARLAEQPADIVLVDTGLSRPDTAGFTRRAREHAPAAVIVFLGPEEPAAAQAAIAAGARGVIRGGEREDLVTTVSKALMLLLRPPRSPSLPQQRGEAPDADEDDGYAAQLHGPGVNSAAAGAGGPPGAGANAGAGFTAPGGMTNGPTKAGRRPLLTERELQVLRGMAEGRSNAEIGRDLFVSEDTVKTHARRLFRKLGARDRAHAVAAAFRAGLVR
jgi:DNA-binding NarL/FixJ family response regulator